MKVILIVAASDSATEREAPFLVADRVCVSVRPLGVEHDGCNIVSLLGASEPRHAQWPSTRGMEGTAAAAVISVTPTSSWMTKIT